MAVLALGLLAAVPQQHAVLPPVPGRLELVVPVPAVHPALFSGSAQLLAGGLRLQAGHDDQLIAANGGYQHRCYQCGHDDRGHHPAAHAFVLQLRATDDDVAT